MEKDIEKILENVDRIPTLPTIVTKLTELVKNPGTSANDINEVINRDQAISARVLKLVNSSFYGFSERISSISHAIVILGFNTIKNVALTASVFDMFETTETETKFDLEGFWMHSVAVAGTARLVSEKLKLPNPEDIFIAGLIHDIGKIILDQHLHHDYQKVLNYVKEKDCLIVEAEAAVLDVTHAQVGAWLATQWKLPPALVQMIGLHHKPELAGDLVKPVFCVHLADILVRAMGCGSGGDKKIPKISGPVLKDLNFSEEMIQSVMQDMVNEIKSVEDFVSAF